MLISKYAKCETHHTFIIRMNLTKLMTNYKFNFPNQSLIGWNKMFKRLKNVKINEKSNYC